MRATLLFTLAFILTPDWAISSPTKDGRPCPAGKKYAVYFTPSNGFEGVCLKEELASCEDVPIPAPDTSWTTDRFIASDEICVCGQNDRMKIVEKKRRSRLGDDLASLMSILKKSSFKDEEPPPCDSYKLKSRRSIVELSSFEDGQEEPAHQFSVLTGPREQWALSVNAAVNKIEQLEIKETDSGNSLELKEAPTRPYLGLDFLTRGDYAADYLNGIIVKLLLEASSTPTDSYGIAIGYRFRGVRSSWFALDAFSPFVGYLWTNQAEARPDGSFIEAGDEKGDWIFGLSLNLDKAGSWLKF